MSHYSIVSIGKGTPAMEALREIFPTGEANSLNFCLFSTSGVHGHYFTIEELEASLRRYGDDPDFPEGGEPEDWAGDDLTVLVVQPRLVCMRYGNVRVRLADIDYLKRLRASSWEVSRGIGAEA